MLIIPVVASVIGNIFFAYHLVDSPITIDNIVDAGGSFNVLEDIQRGLSCALNIVNDNLVERVIARALRILIGTGSLLRCLVTIVGLSIYQAIHSQRIIDVLILF